MLGHRDREGHRAWQQNIAGQRGGKNGEDEKKRERLVEPYYFTSSKSLI
jgi:hypothetical protein